MKNIIKNLVNTLIILFFIFVGNYIFAYKVINFSDYNSKLKNINKNISKYNYKEIESNYKKIKDNHCNRIEYNDSYLVSPICLIKNNYPSMNFYKSINYIRPFIEKFENTYKLKVKEFTTKGSKPIFKKNFELSKQYNNSLAQKRILYILISNNIKISIPKEYIAYQNIKDYTFYAVKKEFEGIGECSLNNYKLALEQINNLALRPGDILNLNKSIAYLDGYCKKVNGYKNLMFYGGVCGTSTHLFRLSLMIPEIEILKRSPHSRRRVEYYDKYIFGDDSALAGLGKELEIKNTGNLPIYIKELNKGDYNYLVGILPYTNSNYTKIQKIQTGPLKAKLTKSIYNYNNKLTKSRIFYSSYAYKHYSSVQ